MPLTPHASHSFGRVAGERRCKRCWSAPTWDIIEEPCPSEGNAHVHGDQDPREWFAPWTDAELARAYELYRAHIPIAEIAAIMGRTLDATSRRIKVYRAAIGAPPMPKRRKIAAMPGTAREVAAATGATMATVNRARVAACKAAP
jgi:hypothetical protein